MVDASTRIEMPAIERTVCMSSCFAREGAEEARVRALAAAAHLGKPPKPPQAAT